MALGADWLLAFEPVALDDSIAPLWLTLELIHFATQLFTQVRLFLPGCGRPGLCRYRVLISEHNGLTLLGKRDAGRQDNQDAKQFQVSHDSGLRQLVRITTQSNNYAPDFIP